MDATSDSISRSSLVSHLLSPPLPGPTSLALATCSLAVAPEEGEEELGAGGAAGPPKYCSTGEKKVLNIDASPVSPPAAPPPKGSVLVVEAVSPWAKLFSYVSLGEMSSDFRFMPSPEMRPGIGDVNDMTPVPTALVL
jgi:hypothetical protein